MARRDIVLDLETLGTAPGCMVAAVALVEVDIINGAIVNSMVVELDLNDQPRYGLVADPSTICWWMTQSDAARQLFKRIGDGQGAPLQQAMVAVSNFILGDTAADPDGPVPHPHVNLWGNGSRFDCGILGELYRRVGMKEPWPFWREKDLRTLKDTVEIVTGGTPLGRTPPTLAHDAMADALAQAQDVINGCRALRNFTDFLRPHTEAITHEEPNDH